MTVLAWVSGGEIVLAAVVGLLLFGGKLPDVAKDFGKVLFRLRRSVDDLRRESGIEDTLRELERESRTEADRPWQRRTNLPYPPEPSAKPVEPGGLPPAGAGPPPGPGTALEPGPRDAAEARPIPRSPSDTGPPGGPG